MKTAEILNAVFICRHKKVRKVFFSEEKKQKTLQIQVLGAACKVRDSVVKVFCFFSSEKKTFLASPTMNKHPAWLEQPIEAKQRVYGQQ